MCHSNKAIVYTRLQDAHSLDWKQSQWREKLKWYLIIRRWKSLKISICKLYKSTCFLFLGLTSISTFTFWLLCFLFHYVYSLHTSASICIVISPNSTLSAQLTLWHLHSPLVPLLPSSSAFYNSCQPVSFFNQPSPPYYRFTPRSTHNPYLKLIW